MSARSIIAREVTSMMTEIGLSQMSNFTNTSNNVLDLIYTNCYELSVVTKVDFLMLPASKSDVDHVPLMCAMECSPSTIPNLQSNLVYCFKKANYNDINEHLSRHVCPTCYHTLL